MKSSALCIEMRLALEKAGLDATNAATVAHHAEIAAIASRLETINRRLTVMKKRPRSASEKKLSGRLYRGVVCIDKIPEVVAKLSQSNIKPTMTALAAGLATSASNLVQIKGKYSHVAELIESSLANAPRLIAAE